MSRPMCTGRPAVDAQVRPDADSSAALHLEAVPGSVAQSRHWVVTQLQALGATEAVAHVAELLTSELVTNAVRHGPSAGVITVSTARDGNAMNVTVSDESCNAPTLCEPAPADLGGRGLLLVEALATEWGVEVHDGRGKSVWFRLEQNEFAA